MDQCERFKESQLCNRLTIFSENGIVLHQIEKMKNNVDLCLVFF